MQTTVLDQAMAAFPASTSCVCIAGQQLVTKAYEKATQKRHQTDKALFSLAWQLKSMCEESRLVPRPFVKYKRTRQRMRVCREKGLVNNYASPRAQEFLLMVISKWLRPHRVHEYRLENLISPKRNTVRGV